MRQTGCFGIFLLVSGALANMSRAAEVSSDPYPGIRHLHRTDAHPPLDLHVLIIDLSYVELEPFITGSGDRGHTVSDFANLYGVDVAWNGGPFAPLGFHPDGFAMGGHAAAVAV